MGGGRWGGGRGGERARPYVSASHSKLFLKLCKKDGCLVFISEYELHKFSEAGKF